MDDKNTYERQYEVFISFNKIWDNLIHYWWIVLICFVLSVLAALGLSYRSYNSTKASYKAALDVQKELIDTMIENQEDQLKYVYNADATIYMARENIDFSAITENVPVLDADYMEENPDYINIYKEQAAANLESTFLALDKALLYDCKALLYTNTVIDELDLKLKAAGYDAYDNYYDYIDMAIVDNARFYKLTFTAEDAGRAEFVIRTVSDILIEQVGDILGIEYCRIVDQASARQYIDWYGTLLPVTDTIVEEKQEELAKIVEDKYKPYDDALNLYNQYSLIGDSLLSMKTILVAFAGIILGFGIILIIILLDRKIRNKEEAELYFGQTVLGEVNVRTKEDLQYSVIAAVLERRCSTDGIRSLLITGTNNGDKTKFFTGKLSEELKKIGKACTFIEIHPGDTDIEMKIASAKKKDGLLIVNAVNINQSSSAILAAGMTDSILFVITANRENIKQIGSSIHHIQLAGGKILGSILLKSGRVFR